MKKNVKYATLLSLMLVLIIYTSPAQAKAKVINSTLKVDSTHVSAISSVSGKDLESYTDFNLSNNLQGRLSGLVVRSSTRDLGTNTSSLYIRGLSSNAHNEALVIIDGMERSIDDIVPEEVETITVLKDATAEILYGARAASGVLLVTTKRGHIGKLNVHASAEMGIMSMTRTPSYLNSYDYANLYNEARTNDGLTPYYSDEELEGYKNSTGNNDVLYPDVDYYDKFLNKQSNFWKASIGMDGGTEKLQYAFVTNYIEGNGFEAIGKDPNLKRINVRGNLNIKINDMINVVADASARFEISKYGSQDGSHIMNKVNTILPNQYPLIIPADVLGLDPAEDGVPYFGASLTYTSNLYAEMTCGGFTEARTITINNNLGVYFDLNDYVEGLKIKSIVSLDNYDYERQGQYNTYPTYAIQNRFDVLSFTQRKKISLQDNQSIKSTSTYRKLGWQTNMDYNHTFNDIHTIKASLGYNYYFQEIPGTSQDINNTNATLAINYKYDNKYAFNGNIASMGSNRFSGDNKYFLSYAFGGSWVISKENFMRNNNLIDFLKLKTSWGHIGYDRATSFLLSESAWYSGSKVYTNEQSKNVSYATNLVRIGNKDLNWEYVNQFNLGLEGSLLNNRLGFEINYFNEKHSDIIMSLSTQYPSTVSSFAYPGNFGEVKNKGFDLDLNWSDTKGDFSYKIGLNATYSKNEISKWNEIPESNPALNYVGGSSDAMKGYQAIGLFGKDVVLDNAVYQSFGPYQEGDIAYEDLNNDNVIDQRDVKTLGNSFPRLTGGITLQLQYKQWGLFVLGTAAAGVDTWTHNNYYWNYGEGKYSTLALDRYNKVSNPDGSMPRLTTLSRDNNFQNSSFWIKDASFFRLKNVELSYNFNKPFSFINNIRVYARATNLFIISSVKDLDPEAINAGINSYPVTSNTSLGLTVTF